MSLTPPLRDLLQAIATHLNTRDRAPTVAQLAVRVNRCPGDVARDLAVLQDLGYIARGRTNRRALRLLVPVLQVVPVAWCDACGQDMPATHTCVSPISSKEDDDG
ncbi:hypothetical protein JOL79_11645 [Microbispora sp. RL4-1S]|uniref:LexA repressor DNA-binding domain-containing protein n=1 Tax=Microbispora oryzae TaxID=2806554 RepID=A0A940WGP9_9ACTN|nr:hypothetical protein [Microbispora oryzae]MBP2704468.1 hypothetical protein [Microbispora oryzae]